MIKVYNEQMIHFEPYYVMGYQVRDGNTRIFMMEDVKNVPIDLLELFIDHLRGTVEDETLFRNALER